MPPSSALRRICIDSLMDRCCASHAWASSDSLGPRDLHASSTLSRRSGSATCRLSSSCVTLSSSEALPPAGARPSARRSRNAAAAATSRTRAQRADQRRGLASTRQQAAHQRRPCVSASPASAPPSSPQARVRQAHPPPRPLHPRWQPRPPPPVSRPREVAPPPQRDQRPPCRCRPDRHAQRPSPHQLRCWRRPRPTARPARHHRRPRSIRWLRSRSARRGHADAAADAPARFLVRCQWLRRLEHGVGVGEQGFAHRAHGAHQLLLPDRPVEERVKGAGPSAKLDERCRALLRMGQGAQRRRGRRLTRSPQLGQRTLERFVCRLREPRNVLESRVRALHALRQQTELEQQRGARPVRRSRRYGLERERQSILSVRPPRATRQPPAAAIRRCAAAVHRRAQLQCEARPLHGPPCPTPPHRARSFSC